MRNGAGFALIYAARILFEFAARAVRASLGACWRFCSWARGRGGLRRRKRRAGRGILARFCVAAFAEIMNNQPLYLVDNDTFLPLSCYYNENCVATPPPFHCKNFKPTNRNIMKKTGSTPKRVDFNERRRIEPRPSICNFRSFDNRKPFVVSVSFSCGSLQLLSCFL